MTQRNNLGMPAVHPASLGKRMLQGAGIALILIAIFLFGVKDPDPAWGKLWMIRPLVVVTSAGAAGGAFYYFMSPLRRQGGWKGILAYVLSVVVYVIGLWLGTVLGLDGTLWN